MNVTNSSMINDTSRSVDESIIVDNKASGRRFGGQTEIPQEEKSGNRIIQFLLCFSFSENVKKVFNSREGGDQNLNVFNGVRVLAICYVMYGHEYSERANNAQNILEVPLITVSNWAMVIEAALYAVDVFFFMSAFLFTYIFLCKLERMQFTVSTYFLTIIHRVLRLWPTLALCLLFWWKLTPYVTSGPIWNEFVEGYISVCEDRWWANLLFIDNYFNTFSTGYCLSWGWYLSNDMQMFLLAPLVVSLLHKNPKPQNPYNARSKRYKQYRNVWKPI